MPRVHFSAHTPYIELDPSELKYLPAEFINEQLARIHRLRGNLSVQSLEEETLLEQTQEGSLIIPAWLATVAAAGLVAYLARQRLRQETSSADTTEQELLADRLSTCAVDAIDLSGISE